MQDDIFSAIFKDILWISGKFEKLYQGFSLMDYH